MARFRRSVIAESIGRRSVETETRTCVDCGENFTARIVARNQMRCAECQEKRNKSRSGRRWRANKKLKGALNGT